MNGSGGDDETRAGNVPPRPGTLGRNPVPVRGPDGFLQQDFRIGAPQVSLPKGGGAISGMGEKVSANPVTGSAALSIPLPLTPARGSSPAVSLRYDSGAGNGPFGLGWRLNIPSVRRKTDKGLPRYRDSGEEADTYVLSDAEDLVPVLTGGGTAWFEAVRVWTDGTDTWEIQRFRPRVEGAFALIERWQHQTSGRIHWRTISSDNVRRTYGRNDSARLVDPDAPARVFEWLLEEEADERGNVISYQYVAEDRANVVPDPAEAHRGTAGNRVAYRYPKRVSWGNTEMYQNPDDGGAGAFRFHLVFDYGDHDETDPSPSPSGTWTARPDPFSWFRAGFDVRCYRLCRRVLLFHAFESVRATPFVVRSVELGYDERPTVCTLSSARCKGWRWTGAWYEQAPLPTTSFTYTQPVIDPSVRLLGGLQDLPLGFDPAQWRFVDLDGEGLSGILTEQGTAWFYKRNEGDGTFAVARRLATRPNLSLAGPGTQLADLDGDGNLDLVVLDPGLAGYHARTPDEDWQPFRSFRRVPSVSADDPRVRYIDLDGDGHADLLLTEDEILTWWPSEAREGFAAPERVRMSRDEDLGPRLVFSRDEEQIFIADMTGDGLRDLVRIRNGNLCYWPNRGYCRFGAKVQMKGVPWFDHPDRFDGGRIRLADVDGSGPTDLLYVGPDGVRLWFNQSGNGFGSPIELKPFPSAARPNDVQVADVLGDGTACLVWSSPLLSETARPLRYVKLMAEGKPWLLTAVGNGLGRETRLSYTPSTAFYVADRAAGAAWATRLPFPVHCLSKIEQVDHVTGWRFVNTYAYHHGYFDGEEREFRGFGLVDQWDAESVSDYEDPDQADPDLVVHLPPVRTRTWFHTGAWRAESTLSAAYAAEYSTADPSAYHLSEPAVPAGLSPRELREAHRALKGRVLRQEIYAEDGEGHLATLLTVTEQTYAVVHLQAEQGEWAPSYRVDDLESLSATYDLDLVDGSPDPRVTHKLTLAVDDYGVPARSASLFYPRRGTDHDAAQVALTVLVSENQVVHQVDDVGTTSEETDDRWHIAVPARTTTWELNGTPAWADTTNPATVDAVNNVFIGATDWTYEQTPTGAGAHKRLIGHQLSRYWDDPLAGPLAVGVVGRRALLYQRYALAYTSGLLAALYGTRVGAAELDEGAYHGDPEGSGPTGDQWIPSGRTTLDGLGFYQPTGHVDPLGNLTTLTWDADFLAITAVEDAVGMLVTAEVDYQLLQPSKITDPNGTANEATFDPLGRVRTTAVRNGTEGDQGTAYSGEYIYETNRWESDQFPARVRVRKLKEHGGSGWEESWAYSDGGGNVVQTKVEAAPGDAPARNALTGELLFKGGELEFARADPRYIGTGRTVLNNKGLVVKQYEPFFSNTTEYEEEDDVVEWGVTPVMTYDPVGRITLVTLPDGHTQRWEYDPWQISAFDESDNDLASPHFDTPAITHLDALGRVYKLVETTDGTTDYVTTLTLDVQGNVRVLNDTRGNDIQVQAFDVLGRPGFTGSADEGYDGSSAEGESRELCNVVGQPIRLWSSGNLTIRNTFDRLRRPVGAYVEEGGGERLVQLTFYGDALSDTPAASFALGRPYLVYDTAGCVTVTYDFRGRAVAEVRQMLPDISLEADWTGLEGVTTHDAIAATTEPALELEAFTVTTLYDALDRVIEQLAPDGSRTARAYDRGGRLCSVDGFVDDIRYSARGQRERIEYANHTTTTYEYDPARLWLTRLITVRSADSPHGEAALQDLTYSRDAVGNLTAIADDAQETLYFQNAEVTPDRTFAYDALYRLVAASGREKVVQTQTSAFYAGYAGPPGAIPDGANPALRRYTQRYRYDAAGNLQEMKHQLGDGGAVLWRRGYAYAAGNNQLVSTSVPGDDPDAPATHTDRYTHNARGAMVSLPHLRVGGPNLLRDFRDQIRRAELDSAGNVAWYAYDADGRRVRKVWDKGSVVEERIYVGPYEVWRRRDGGGRLQEERQTLHVMDDQRRIAVVETLTVSEGTAVADPTPRFRFQLDDHLGTALLELDDVAGIIDYEEYQPYGSTAWWASSGFTDVSQKRYRYTGKEKDDETGLAYHGARYLLPWLGRWERADPIGLKGGLNRFEYCWGRPTDHRDPEGKAPLSPTVPTADDEVDEGALSLEILRRSKSTLFGTRELSRWVDLSDPTGRTEISAGQLTGTRMVAEIRLPTVFNDAGQYYVTNKLATLDSGQQFVAQHWVFYSSGSTAPDIQRAIETGALDAAQVDQALGRSALTSFHLARTPMGPGRVLKVQDLQRLSGASTKARATASAEDAEIRLLLEQARYETVYHGGRLDRPGGALSTTTSREAGAAYAEGGPLHSWRIPKEVMRDLESRSLVRRLIDSDPRLVQRGIPSSPEVRFAPSAVGEIQRYYVSPTP